MKSIPLDIFSALWETKTMKCEVMDRNVTTERLITRNITFNILLVSKLVKHSIFGNFENSLCLRFNFWTIRNIICGIFIRRYAHNVQSYMKRLIVFYCETVRIYCNDTSQNGRFNWKRPLFNLSFMYFHEPQIESDILCPFSTTHNFETEFLNSFRTISFKPGRDNVQMMTERSQVRFQTRQW